MKRLWTFTSRLRFFDSITTTDDDEDVTRIIPTTMALLVQFTAIVTGFFSPWSTSIADSNPTGTLLNTALSS